MALLYDKKIVISDKIIEIYKYSTGYAVFIRNNKSLNKS